MYVPTALSLLFSTLCRLALWIWKCPGQHSIRLGGVRHDDVVAAREDKEKLQNEADRYGLSIVPEARGQAFARIQAAEAYREEVVANAEGEAVRFDKLLAEYQKAPKVTRDRLYLDALQGLYSNSTKVLMDVEGGNNLMYLPLDKILEQNKSEEEE